jgi:hypothetical protein
MSKKQNNIIEIDDTTLEYYWLTEEDIKEMKSDLNEWIDGEMLHKAVKIQEFLYYMWIYVELDDIIDFITKAKPVDESIYGFVS